MRWACTIVAQIMSGFLGDVVQGVCYGLSVVKKEAFMNASDGAEPGLLRSVVRVRCALLNLNA